MFSAQISVQNLCANHSHPPCTQMVIEKPRFRQVRDHLFRVSAGNIAACWPPCPGQGGQFLATLPAFGNLARVWQPCPAGRFPKGTRSSSAAGLPTMPTGWTAAPGRRLLGGALLARSKGQIGAANASVESLRRLGFRAPLGACPHRRRRRNGQSGDSGRPLPKSMDDHTDSDHLSR
jgi:hypothetical protein